MPPDTSLQRRLSGGLDHQDREGRAGAPPAPAAEEDRLRAPSTRRRRDARPTFLEFIEWFSVIWTVECGRRISFRPVLRWLLAVGFVLSAVSGIPAASLQPGLVKQQFIFAQSFTPTNHSSTIVETKSSLLAAWFGGPEARHPSNTIFTARYDRGKWSDPQQIADGVQADGHTRYQCWNPVLFQPARGPLLLFYKVGPSPETWWSMLMISTNEGRTWSKPTRLPDGCVGPVRNKPVELADGSLLCGASTESNGWAVHMERCFGLGERWEDHPAGESPFVAGDPANDSRARLAVAPGPVSNQARVHRGNHVHERREDLGRFGAD
jgi:hypothetical protein